MSSFRLVLPILLLTFSLTVHAKSEASELTKKVKNKLGPEMYKKVFGTQHDNVEQYEQGVTDAAKAAADAFGTTFPESQMDELENVVKKYANKCTPEICGTIYLNAIGQTLQDKGVLTDKNVDEIAEGVANALKEEAPSVETDNIEETAPAEAKGFFKYLKSKGLASEDVLKLFIDNFLKEVELTFN